MTPIQFAVWSLKCNFLILVNQIFHFLYKTYHTRPKYEYCLWVRNRNISIVLLISYVSLRLWRYTTSENRICLLKNIFFSKCLLRHGGVRVFVLFCVLVFVRAILSWCPSTWHIYTDYNILSLNISSIYITTVGVECLCGGWKMSPRTTSLCSLIWSSGIVDCMLFTFESRVPLMR